VGYLEGEGFRTESYLGVSLLLFTLLPLAVCTVFGPAAPVTYASRQEDILRYR
jgi:hypothetical protein